MSRIDEELEQAVRENEARKPAARRGSAAGGDVDSPVVADAEEQKKSWGLLGGLVALGAGVLLFVFNSGDDAVVYAYQVDDLKAQAAELGDRPVRVQGVLVSGTLVHRDDPCEHKFLMKKADSKAEPLSVVYPQCVVPDTFRDVAGVAVEVTAEGRLAADGHLEASKIFAKCPSKYEMREEANAKGGAPKHGGGLPKPEFIPAKEETASAIR